MWGAEWNNHPQKGHVRQKHWAVIEYQRVFAGLILNNAAIVSRFQSMKQILSICAVAISLSIPTESHAQSQCFVDYKAKRSVIDTF